MTNIAKVATTLWTPPVRGASDQIVLPLQVISVQTEASLSLKVQKHVAMGGAKWLASCHVEEWEETAHHLWSSLAVWRREPTTNTANTVSQHHLKSSMRPGNDSGTIYKKTCKETKQKDFLLTTSAIWFVLAETAQTPHQTIIGCHWHCLKQQDPHKT